jgi:hypothetical protein
VKQKLSAAEEDAARAALAVYEALITEITDGHSVVASKMFGMPCLKVDGKAAAGLFNDSMTFKLAGAAHATALALDGAHLFDPSAMGRPMKEWVQVPYANRDRWASLAEAAIAYVRNRS